MIIKLDYSNSKPIHINTVIRLKKLLLRTNSTFEKKSHGIQRSFSSKNLLESSLLWKLNRGVHLLVKKSIRKFTQSQNKWYRIEKAVRNQICE